MRTIAKKLNIATDERIIDVGKINSYFTSFIYLTDGLSRDREWNVAY